MAFSIRRAEAGDAAAIRRLVRTSGINPLGIHWQRFVVAEDEARDGGGSGRIIGIGQIKVHGDGSRELASIATLPDRQGEGIATAIIETLLRADAGVSEDPLYLTCRAHMEPFYERFGFRRVQRLAGMPAYFRRLLRLGRPLFALARLFGQRDEGIVMVRKGE